MYVCMYVCADKECISIYVWTHTHGCVHVYIRIYVDASTTMPDEIYVQFKLATQGLGTRCIKPQLPELRRWVARALVVKCCQDSLTR